MHVAPPLAAIFASIHVLSWATSAYTPYSPSWGMSESLKKKQFTHSGASVSPADHPDKVVLVGGAALHSERPSTVALAWVFPRRTRTNHFAWDRATVAGRKGDALAIRRLGDGVARGGFASGIGNNGNLDLKQNSGSCCRTGCCASPTWSQSLSNFATFLRKSLTHRKLFRSGQCSQHQMQEGMPECRWQGQHLRQVWAKRCRWNLVWGFPSFHGQWGPKPASHFSWNKILKILFSWI